MLAGTRKPFKIWFRALFEISSRRNAISAKELQPILGFGAYEPAWTWGHKIRGSLKRAGREPLGEGDEIVEAFVGGKRLGKSMVLVATETDGRVRLAHALTNDAETLKAFADANLAADTHVTSDGHAGYNATSLGERAHDAIVQTNAERAVADTLQRAHCSVSMLKRWLMSTHAGAVKARHLQAYLDEFTFRWNRRKTNGVGRISARTIAMLVSHPPRTMRAIVDGARPDPLFVPVK